MKLENLSNYRTLVGVNYTQRANDQLIFNLTKEDFPHFSKHKSFSSSLSRILVQCDVLQLTFGSFHNT